MRSNNDSNFSNRMSGNQYFDSISGLKNAVYIHSGNSGTPIDSLKVPPLPNLRKNERKDDVFHDKRKS